MSLDYWVVNGNIPVAKLKAALKQGKIVGSQLANIKIGYFAIKYDKKGQWNAEEIRKGNVTWFVEYACCHGGDKAMDQLISQLERMFKCEITGDYDEYKKYTEKVTGKKFPKDPHAGCSEVMYNKEFPKGKCMNRFPETGLPKDFWL
jgi:hypothetical protein